MESGQYKIMLEESGELRMTYTDKVWILFLLGTVAVLVIVLALLPKGW